MGASPIQFDLQSGFDLTSLSSATQAQIMQALNQMAPLSNIGGIIIMNGNNGEHWPGVTNNPRFKRYIWIDTYTAPAPVMKVHDQTGADTYAAWVSATLADGAVTLAKLAASSVRSDKMSVANPAGGNWTSRFICRINAAGTAVEFANPNAIFNNSELPREAIDVTGAPAGTSFLKRDASGGTTSWAKPSFSDISGTLGIGSIAPSATNNQVLATLGGAVVWDEIQDIIADGVLPIAKLVGAGTALHVLRRNAANTATEWGLPTFSKYEAIEDSANLDVNYPEGAATARNIAHTLGEVPKLVRVTIICKIADLNYNVGEEVPIEQLQHQFVSDNSGRPTFGFTWTSTAVRTLAANCAAGTRFALDRTTAAWTGITQANWRLKIHVWA